MVAVVILRALRVSVPHLAANYTSPTLCSPLPLRSTLPYITQLITLPPFTINPYPQDTTAIPVLHLREQQGGTWVYSDDLTKGYLGALSEIASQGLRLRNKTVLMTGCGSGSIGEAILNAVLAAGAQVVVTSSSFNIRTTEFFRHKYEKFGGLGSSLTLLPFNQGSVQV